MRRRIPINASGEETVSRRSALTRLARIAQACTVVSVVGLAPERAYASGNLGNWNPDTSTVYYDGASPC